MSVCIMYDLKGVLAPITVHPFFYMMTSFTNLLLPSPSPPLLPHPDLFLRAARCIDSTPADCIPPLPERPVSHDSLSSLIRLAVTPHSLRGPPPPPPIRMFYLSRKAKRAERVEITVNQDGRGLDS